MGKPVLMHRGLRREGKARSFGGEQDLGQRAGGAWRNAEGLMWNKCGCAWKGQASS